MLLLVHVNSQVCGACHCHWPNRSPAHGHTLKTKQDRPLVTLEHYIEVGTRDSIATFTFSPHAPPEIF